jgi:uncharacterized protein YggE
MDMQNTSTWGGGFKAIVAILGVLLIVFVALTIGDKAYSLSKTARGVKPDNTISVSATGKSKAVPDIAQISLGVYAQGRDAKEAQNKAAESINKIIAFVKAQGVASEDITTTNNGLNPRYDYQSGQNNIVGYDSNQTVSVKVRGVNTPEGKTKAETIMAGSVDNGANQMYGSQFVIDDPDQARQEARKQAIEKAKAKAKELADAAGIKLGKVVSVQDGEGSYPPGIPYAADAVMGKGMGGAERSAIAPSIEPGSQEVTQTVTLVFEVK